MTVHQAAVKWQRRQEKLIGRAYAQGWETGVRNFRSQQATPAATKRGKLPARPNQATQARVLAPALSSLQRTAVQLAAVVPTAAQVAAAGTAAAAVALAAREFLLGKAWLLALAVYVLWAAEQAGYSEAAASQGLLLRWQLDARADHCEDCPALAKLPPMPLDQWPSLPGEGATACRQGCKCSLHAVPGAVPQALTVEQQDLVSRIGSKPGVLVAA